MQRGDIEFLRVMYALHDLNIIISVDFGIMTAVE